MKYILSESQTQKLIETLTADVIKGVGSVIYSDNDADLKNPKTISIDVDKISKTQPKNQSKTEKNYNSEVADIIKKLNKNKKFTPVVVYKDGEEYVMLDGHHRLDAYKKLNKKKINAIVIPKKNVKFHKKITKKMQRDFDKLENPS